MIFPIAEIKKIRTSKLAHSAGWMLVGQGISLVLQAGYFILLARLLGVKEYGVFAGAFALVGIVMPYSAMGSGILFMRYVSADRDLFPSYWGNILLSSVTAGTILSISLYLVAPRLLNSASASLVLFVAIGNCVFSQMVSNMGIVFQTYERLRMTAALNILTNGLRLLAVGIMTILLVNATARQWAIASLCVSLVAALVSFVIVCRSFGLPKFVPGLLKSRAGEGFGYSLGASANSIYNDVDKTMLSHYGMNIQNGIYTMAYRVIDIGTIPISSVDAAALPRFFSTSSKEPHKVAPLAFRLALRACLIGLFVSLALFVAAPLIPHIVGKGFTESILALRWLCLLPAFRGVHQLTGSAITGMGRYQFRTAGQFAAAGLNVALNLWLIPRYGWIGAASSSLATDGALAVVNCLILIGLSREGPGRRSLIQAFRDIVRSSEER